MTKTMTTMTSRWLAALLAVLVLAAAAAATARPAQAYTVEDTALLQLEMSQYGQYEVQAAIAAAIMKDRSDALKSVAQKF